MTTSKGLALGFGMACWLGPTTVLAQIGTTEPFLGQNGDIAFTVLNADGSSRANCNDGFPTPIPGDPAHVLARYDNACNNAGWSLARWSIDWSAKTITFVNMVIDTSGGQVPVYGGNSLANALEPVVMSYGGQLWVSFECDGNIPAANTPNSSCVGPINTSNWTLDTAHTTVALVGTGPYGSVYYSASVPKILNFNGNAYIYWTAVAKTSPTGSWINLTARGMQLTNYGGVLFSSEVQGSVGAADSIHTIEVWGLGTDGNTNEVADIQGVFTDGFNVFGAAGEVGTNCGSANGSNGFDPVNCYRLAIAKSTSALSAGMFNSNQLPSSELTSETGAGYIRYFEGPGGQGYLLGLYSEASGSQSLPAPGIVAYPIPWDATYFGALAGVPSGTVAQNQSGLLEAFGVGSDGALWHNWQLAAGGWFGWASLGGAVKNPVVQRNADGRLEAFGVGTDNAIWHNWQTVAGGGWAGWASLGGVVEAPVAARNTDGRLEVLAVGAGDALYDMSQTTPGGGWSAWKSLGGQVMSPVVARNADGRLEAFAIAADGSLGHIYQQTPGGNWSGWASLGGISGSPPAVVSNADGRLEVFAVGTDDALYHIYQSTPGGAWSAWSSLGGYVREPAVQRNADGRLEAFAIGVDGAIWHTWQTAAGGAWASGWASMGQGPFLAPSVQRDPNGTLEIFAIGPDATLWHNWQTTPGGGWFGWFSMGGGLMPLDFGPFDDDEDTAVVAPDAGPTSGDGGGAADGGGHSGNPDAGQVFPDSGASADGGRLSDGGNLTDSNWDIGGTGRSSSGCGCNSSDGSSASSVAGLWILSLAVLFWRRKSRGET